jgi:hypothetical protein
VRLSTLDAAATTADPTWDNTEAALWSFLELSIAILAVCLPTLRPLVLKIFPRLMQNSTPNAPDTDPYTGPQSRQLKATSSAGASSGDGTGSTDALNYDTELGLQQLSPKGVATTGGAYSETVICAGIDAKPPRESEQSVKGNGNGIRAITVVKQEFYAV